MLLRYMQAWHGHEVLRIRRGPPSVVRRVHMITTFLNKILIGSNLWVTILYVVGEQLVWTIARRRTPDPEWKRFIFTTIL